MDEIPELIRFTKDLILSLDKYRSSIISVPNLIKELIHLGKTFNKIEVRMNEYPNVLNLTPAYLAEANSCLNLLRETLNTIQNQLNLYSSHADNTNRLRDKVWMTVNGSQMTHHFTNFANQIKSHADHILINFLPVLNTIINHSEKGKVSRSVHHLGKHDRERICSMIMREGNIMKIFIPSGGQKMAPADEANVVHKADDPSTVELDRQSNATRFLIGATPASGQAHHEASDMKEDLVENDAPDDHISFGRLESFSAAFGQRRTFNAGGGRSQSISAFFAPSAVKDAKEAAAATSPPTDRDSFSKAPAGWKHTDFDTHLDYYHIKWFTVLPQVWAEFPDLTFGQIKYIYLTSNFFEYYHKDIYFINPKTIEEVYQLQLYMEAVEEVPKFAAEDYEYVAHLISENPKYSVKQLIHALNQRFKGRREFSFLVVSGFFRRFRMVG